MGDRARVANIVEIEGTLYAQVECVEMGKTGEYLGALALKRIPKERQFLLLRGLRDFILGRAKEALRVHPGSDHAKILGALSVLIGKVPTILRDRLPEITVFRKVEGNLFGFAFYAPERRRNLLALYQPFATDKTVSAMAFLFEMEKFLMEAGILQLASPAESILQISVNIRGRLTGTTFKLARKSARQILNRGARRNRRNKAVHQYWLLRALNRELFPGEERVFLQRVTQEEDLLQREALVEDFLEEMGVEPVPETAGQEDSPLVLTEIEGEAMVSALQEEPFQETLEKEETFETALCQIVENAIKQVQGDLKKHYEKQDMAAFLNELKRLMTTRENAKNAVTLLRLLLRTASSKNGVREHVTDFLIGHLLSRVSLGQPELYEEAVSFLNEIKEKDGSLTEMELLMLLGIHGEAYSRLGLFLEDLFAEVDAIDALAALRKVMKDMVTEGLYRDSKSYERALGLLKPVAIKLDQSETLEEGVWFILEQGFKDQAEASGASSGTTAGSEDVIEDAPPMEPDQSFIDEDILKTMIASSRFSHLSKQELMAKMSSAGGLRG